MDPNSKSVPGTVMSILGDANGGGGVLPGWVTTGIGAIIAALSSAVVALFKWTQKRLCDEIKELKENNASLQQKIESLEKRNMAMDERNEILKLENLELRFRGGMTGENNEGSGPKN